MSLVTAYYHIVINTYRRRMTIPEANKRELYRYIYGILRNSGCMVLRINGIGNHVHLLVSLPPTLALSKVVGEMKRSSSLWIKKNAQLFPDFECWGQEYYAATISPRTTPSVIDYIKNQESHHYKCRFEDELQTLVTNDGAQWSEHLLS